MKFGPVAVGAAQGSVLGHSVKLPEGALKKGKRLGPAEIALLEAAGLTSVIVARLEAGDVAEDEAAQRMAEALAALGIAGAYEGAMRHAGNPTLLSRTHFARFLVEAGHCSDLHDVFRRYLADGKPGFVPHEWASLGDAVRWITDAGGIAVVAHPARYRFTPTEEYALFTEFVGHGGQAVEVITPSHSPAEQASVADLAREFGLLASRGSDFHAPGESRAELGALPDLPGRLIPVWDALAPRIQRAA
ncbi:MAG: phosphatase [Rubrivivax sp.]